MRNLVLVFIILLFAGFKPGAPAFTRWVVTKGCSLKVDGKTNVNSSVAKSQGMILPIQYW